MLRSDSWERQHPCWQHQLPPEAARDGSDSGEVPHPCWHLP